MALTTLVEMGAADIYLTTAPSIQFFRFKYKPFTSFAFEGCKQNKRSSRKVLPSELDTPCSICLNDWNSEDTCTTLPCQHIFHAACISSWLEKNPTCPLCRKPAS